MLLKFTPKSPLQWNHFKRCNKNNFAAFILKDNYRSRMLKNNISLLASRFRPCVLKRLPLVLFVVCSMLTACSSTDSYGPAGNRTLVFGVEQVDLGTVFAGVPSARKDIWVYNPTGEGIVCSEIRLAQGNQTGFRVNVDGWYLGPTSGYRVQDVEIASGDSIRVFVELTSYPSGSDEPVAITDDLIFSLSGGTTQRLPLTASVWDAVEVPSYNITANTTISSEKPMLVKENITVAENATLTIAAGTTLYFDSDAGINVNGTLICEGTAEQNVILRGQRIDNMFDYLPYDRVPGQWRGLHFSDSSVGNRLTYTDIHSTFDGIIVDQPTDTQAQHLALEQVTIHNCQGYGLLSVGANISLVNTQISNTLNDCLFIDGGSATVNGSTLAQFYPLDADRGAALRFSNGNNALGQMLCQNSLITGYADDVVMGNRQDNGNDFNYRFENCLLRTVAPAESEQANFVDTELEDITDADFGSYHHFLEFDTENLIYDFSLAENSTARGKANAETCPAIDRTGLARGDAPDLGAFQYVPKEE